MLCFKLYSCDCQETKTAKTSTVWTQLMSACFVPKPPETIPNDFLSQFICGRTPGKRPSNFLWWQFQPLRRRRREREKNKTKKNKVRRAKTPPAAAVRHQPSHYFQRLLPAQRYSAFSVNQYTSGALIQKRKRRLRATAATGEQCGSAFQEPLRPSRPTPCLARAAAIKS